ncbi:MAG: DUF4080 domain-containing protein [Peptostreptococcaceae bacterium]|nr:DUF4080 domain-containing protein [Peptostreptococcaceae bacterium]MDY5739528.1 DUF4080 domain-containing protein [Anaerovoracaceae bacterium]
MKLLLTTLNSKYVHSNLALKYLYNAVAGGDFQVDLKEFTLNNEADYVYGEILKPGYDMVCFSCYIWNIEKTKELCANLKAAQPRLKILLGGPEVSFDCADFMEENPWCDYIIRGEGERSIFEFCKNVTLGKPLEGIAGLVLRGAAGRIIDNGLPCAIDLNRLQFPYARLPLDGDKVVYYETSRGCPFRCSYCLSSIDKGIRSLSMDRVKHEFKYFNDRKVKQVKLLDRTFNYDRDRAAEIWKYLIENDNGVTNFHFEICGDLLRDEDFALLEKARPELFRFEIGIQTVNGQVLQAVGRNDNTLKLFENIRRLIKTGNIELHVDLIAGLPGEDMRSFANSFNEVYGTGADEIQLGFLKLLRGTEIRDEADEFGYVFRHKAPYEVISTTGMSAEELVSLKELERVLDVFYNRGGFGRALSFLMEGTNLSPFDFYEDLARFYHENGYQHRYHKKEDNYRILYGYALAKELMFPIEYKDFTEATMNILRVDLEETMNFDAVKKFYKKGWMFNGK